MELFAKIVDLFTEIVDLFQEGSSSEPPEPPLATGLKSSVLLCVPFIFADSEKCRFGDST